MKSLVFLILLLISNQEYAQLISIQEINDLNQEVKYNCGPDFNVLTIVPYDRIEKTMGQNGFNIENVSTLNNSFIFIAYTKYPTDEFNIYAIVGIYKNGSIIWKSDPVMKWDFLSQTSIPGIMDINSDGFIDIIIFCHSGKEGQLVDVWILSWDGFTGWFINGIDEKGYSVMFQTLYDEISLLDADGNGKLEVSVGDRCYYWDGSLYDSFFPCPIIVPKNKLSAEVNCYIEKISDTYRYVYKIKNFTSSLQKILLFGFDACSKSIFNFIQPLNWNFFYREDEKFIWSFIKSPEWNYPESFIRPGEEKNNYSFISPGLPRIVNFYVQGYNTESDLEIETVKSNSFITKTISPADPPESLIMDDFIDSLLSYTSYSFQLGWIKNQTTANKYDSLFTLAKTQLQQNNKNAAKSTLQTVLQQVDIDSTNNLTSEAYALIRYNTEYLISKIPDQSLLNVAAINPAMTLVNPGSFTMEVKGTGFTTNSTVYFNGNARTTTFISDSILSAEIISTDVSVAGNYPVWVSSGTINSDTLTFRVVSTLPKPVRPVLECVRNNGDGTYTAYFGYKNENEVSVHIPVGNKNKFTPSPQDRGQTRVFKPGRQYRVFTVDFNGSNLVWTLNGRTSTASSNSAPCN